jgi:glutamine synthetase adenylyltransferase
MAVAQDGPNQFPRAGAQEDQADMDQEVVMEDGHQVVAQLTAVPAHTVQVVQDQDGGKLHQHFLPALLNNHCASTQSTQNLIKPDF